MAVIYLRSLKIRRVMMKFIVCLLFACTFPLWSDAQDAVHFKEGPWEDLSTCAACASCGAVESAKLEQAKTFSFYCNDDVISEWVLVKVTLPACDSVYYKTLEVEDYNKGQSEFGEEHLAMLDIYQEVRYFCSKAKEIKRLESPYSDLSLHVIQHFFTPFPQEAAPVSEGNEIFKIAEEMPRFPGCEHLPDLVERKKCADKLMLEFVYTHVKYPEVARAQKIEGTTVVSFVVEKDGTVSNIKPIRFIGAGCANAAVEAVAQMNDEGIIWVPGKVQGEAVRTQFNLPVKFRLE